MQRHRLSDLPISALYIGLEILSNTGITGKIDAIDITNKFGYGISISIKWDNGNESWQPAECLDKVYVIDSTINYDLIKTYRDEDLSPAQLEFFKGKEDGTATNPQE